MALKKSRKCSGFVVYSYLRNSVFTAVKIKGKHSSKYVCERVPFVNRSYTEEVLFLGKNGIYKGEGLSGLTLGQSCLPI